MRSARNSRPVRTSRPTTSAVAAVVVVAVVLAAGCTGDGEGAVDSPSSPPAPRGLLVAMGDSFASGEGTFRYDPATDVLDPEAPNRCHRSPLAYPSLLEGYDAVSLACSGASSADVLGRSRFGEPPQVQQLAELVARERTEVDAVVLSLGANDAGFVDVLGSCLALEDCSERVRALDAPLDRARDRVTEALDAITATARTAEVVLVGYPTTIGEVGCVDRLTAGEAEAIGAWLAGLRTALRAAAADAGVAYLDPSEAFAGHGPCADEPHLHGVVYGFPLLSVESFHPTVAGHVAIAELLTATLQR